MKSHFINGASALALSLATLSAGSAFAQSLPEALQNTDLNTVTVTASRGAALASLDVSTTTVTSAQVESSPENTVDQIVNKIPGVFTSQVPAAQLHPTGQEFNIRGFGTTTNVNTLVMDNGVPMNDPYFRTVDWSQLPKSEVDRIEIIRGGGATSLWGNMAMGGIVNIVTRTPGPGNDNVEASYGSFNTYSGDIALGTTLSDQLKIGGAADVTKTDGYNQTPALYRNPYMDATASQNNNFSASAVYTPTANSEVYANFVDHRIRENGLVWNIASNTWTTDRATVGGSYAFDPTTSVNATGWYGWNTMATTNSSNASYTIFTPTLGVPYVSQTETVRYSNYGGSAFINSAWGDVKDIKAGVDFRSITSDDPLNLFSATAQTGTIEARAQHHFEGLFAQGSWHVPQVPLEVTLGLREDFWQTSNGSIVGVYKGAAFANTLSNETYNHFDPRLGAKYHLTDELDLRAAVYEDFAAPGMNQMYRAFISGSNFTTSNPTLLPQTNLGEEAGFDYTHKGLTLSVTGFYNNLSNFIDYATVQSGCAAGNNYCGTNISTISGGSLRQYVNAGNAVLSGIEVLGGWKASDTLSFTAGYTQTDAHLTSSKYNIASSGVIPDPTGQQIGQVPPWIATASADWSPIERLKLSLRLKSFPNYWNNTSHTQLNQGTTIADIGGSYRVYGKVEVFALVQNVGNAHYLDQGLGYTTTNGSTVSSSTVPALGLPLDATVGVRARF
jgi:outer membrane receptor protein involved in Fe transport